jgi:hypothetical protein
MLDLLNLGTEKRDALLQDTDTSARLAFGALVGAAFSLWRGAFLSDITRSWERILDTANDLLKTVLICNSVPFSTDRATRDWMMGYYLNNARYRLAAARDNLRSDPETPAFRRFAELHQHGITDVDRQPTEIWDTFFDVFCELLEILRLRMS